MEKSMYSLILMDEVVRQIDKLAYNQGTSRSNMINQILAEYLSLTTPQSRLEQIFSETVRQITQAEKLQIQPQPSGSMITIKSAVNYKYNPTIRYYVEINVDKSRYSGEFRAVSRSQSRDLLLMLESFFNLWSVVERTALANRLSAGVLDCNIDGGKFARRLVVDMHESADTNMIGEALGRYIRVFDKSLSLYFENPQNAKNEISVLYSDYISKTPVII